MSGKVTDAILHFRRQQGLPKLAEWGSTGAKRKERHPEAGVPFLLRNRPGAKGLFFDFVDGFPV
jgi:hypothetical protein